MTKDSTKAAGELMSWVQDNCVDSFDDEEIMGDHRIIVDLYNYCRSLEAKLKIARGIIEAALKEDHLQGCIGYNENIKDDHCGCPCRSAQLFLLSL